MSSDSTGAQQVADGVTAIVAGIRQLKADNPAAYAAVLAELQPPAAVLDLAEAPPAEPYTPGAILSQVDTSGAGLAATEPAIPQATENAITQGLQAAIESDQAAVKLALTILMAAAMAAAA